MTGLQPPGRQAARLDSTRAGSLCGQRGCRGGPESHSLLFLALSPRPGIKKKTRPWASIYMERSVHRQAGTNRGQCVLARPAAEWTARPLPAGGPPQHLFWPRRMAFSSLPYLFLIHLIPCSWASTMSGQRSVLHRMVAFSVDMRSLGSPWLFHVATSASSVSRLKGSRPSVMGMGTWPGGTSPLRRDGAADCSTGKRPVVASQAPCDGTAGRPHRPDGAARGQPERALAAAAPAGGSAHPAWPEPGPGSLPRGTSAGLPSARGRSPSACLCTGPRTCPSARCGTSW